jgi:hypothetical protein
MHARTWTLAMALAVAVPPAAHAAGFDSLRCQAIGMRKEGQRFECLGRCERRSARRAQVGATADSGLTTCQQACEDRFANAMTQLDQREVCGGGPGGDPPAADPNKCQARLMRAKATLLMCDSDCSRAGGEVADVRACLQQCGQRYAGTIDDLLSKPYCAGQPAPQ